MQNFDFYNPVQVLFGKGQIANLGMLLAPYSRIMLLYGGGSIMQNGVYEQIKAALGEKSCIEFGGIEANPTYETLMRAVEIGRNGQIDFILAAGGGSVIDGAKFVAAAIPFQDGDPWQILEKWGRNVHSATPFGCVLTLAATGSETNCASVITQAATRSKRSFSNRAVFARFAIMDPQTQYSLPPRQIGNGVVDSFVHVVEQYLTQDCQAAVQDRLAEGILLTLIEQGPKALQEPQNYAVRADLMWAASMALNGMCGVGVIQDWSTHMVGHELTALYGLDHAQTLAVVLPAMLRERRAQKQNKLLQFARRVWQLESREASPEAVCEMAIAKTEQFFREMGVKTRLSEYGLDSQAIEAVQNALRAHRMVSLGEQRDITPEVVGRVLQRCL
ncbi:iron-containing alcohol dehydrogenase [Massilia sp. W12]|uniref:iron-containing alcohol dehydrogenase n=1 Tax=Massilia sp. W12 TaxID=3126507 RepID=UPI0030D58913